MDARYKLSGMTGWDGLPMTNVGSDSGADRFPIIHVGHDRNEDEFPILVILSQTKDLAEP